MKFLVSLLISALFLYLALRGLDFGAIGQSLAQVQYGMLIPAMLIHLASFWVRGLRWRSMLIHLKPVTSRALFPPLAISYLANNTLPMRAGEVVRAYLVGRNEGISKAASFSSIVLERVCDGLTLLLFLGGVALIAPLPDWARQVGLLAGTAFVGVAVVMAGLVFAQALTLAVIRAVTQRLPNGLGTKIETVLGRFVSGLDVLQNRKELVRVFAWSLVIWGIEALALQMTAIACGLDLSLTSAFFTLVIINLGTMIPSSPGYVGTFEFFCVKSLAAFQVAAAPAMGFALVLHVVQFLPITLVGLVCLMRQQVSLRSMTKEVSA